MLETAHVRGGVAALPLVNAGLGPVRALLRLAQTLCALCGQQQVFHPPGAARLYLLYPDSCCEVQTLLRACGNLMGTLCPSFPVVLCGRIGILEGARITAAISEGRVVLQQYNATGTPFELLYDVCLSIRFPSEALCRSFDRPLAALQEDSQYAAFGRDCPQTLLMECEPLELFYYRYAALEDKAPDYAALLRALDVERILRLWRGFLETGACHEEFTRLWELLEAGCPFDAYLWAFALELAVQQQGVSLSRGADGFAIYKRDGGRIHADFEMGSAAEKLLLKFIFPSVPPA